MVKKVPLVDEMMGRETHKFRAEGEDCSRIGEKSAWGEKRQVQVSGGQRCGGRSPRVDPAPGPYHIMRLQLQHFSRLGPEK